MKRSGLLPLLVLGATLPLTFCATIGPPQPPSLDLPKPPEDLRATRKGNQVTLTWTVPNMTTDRQTIRTLGPTQICRNLVELQECGAAVGQAPAPAANTTSEQRARATFIDTLPSDLENKDASSSMVYAVEVLNRSGRGAGLSNRVRVLLAPTLPPPSDLQGRVTSEGVVLNWTSLPVPPGIPANVHVITRVYRRASETQQQSVVGEVPIGGEAKLTDSGIEWERTYDYHVAEISVVSKPDRSQEEVAGPDSSEIKVFTHDVFPPAVPSGLQAVFSGPGQSLFVDLVWAPVTDADLAGYNVYRREEGAKSEKLNLDPLKAPSYRDTHVSAGTRYYYSVTSVDIRGNESAKSEETSEAVP